MKIMEGEAEIFRRIGGAQDQIHRIALEIDGSGSRGRGLHLKLGIGVCYRIGGKLGEVINGEFGLVDEPIDGPTGAIVAESVLEVVESDGGVGGQSEAAVAGAFGSGDLAVAVLPSGGAGAEDVAAGAGLHCVVVLALGWNRRPNWGSFMFLFLRCDSLSHR